MMRMSKSAVNQDAYTEVTTLSHLKPVGTWSFNRLGNHGFKML